MNYLRINTLFLTFLLSFVLTDSTTNAKSGQTFEVNADYLIVRSAPSPEADIIGKLNRGSKVRIFQEDSGWVQTYFKGKAVWVSSQYLSPLQKEEQEVFFPNGLLAGYTIVIDPGHGGKDPGAIGQNGIMEKELILETSLIIAEKIRESGGNVILTRADDSFVSLKNRVLISNQHEVDAFISIHFNAYSADYVGGINTYYYKNGRRLANIVQKRLSEEVSLRNRGVIQDNYRVLRDNKHPAILIELGFITNTTELATIQSQTYQDNVARGITIGLIEYFMK
ncbi:N-acetylmuramoyl-L-alanine amidase [Ornithinibacillus scapharcae]|uniref:N-acetylmuramoyl-L-alanine amidase n=1 Tax=Ornithinibacillus scapharcae TaxID=1147159 RepID=UPI000225B3B5|nr:N-acetylmuramoyl-L-alanine amidase [Ornithinibacillus scapharcae]